MPNYKAWIYSVNFSILVFEALLAFLAYRTMTDPWWRLIPIYLTDGNMRIYECIMIVQVFTCLCGLGGVWFSTLILLKVYWVFMIPLTVLDMVMLIPFVDQVSAVHGTFQQHLQKTVLEQIRFDDNCCATWDSIQIAFECCAPSKMLAYCNYLVRNDSSILWNENRSCNDSNALQCNDHILRWMTFEAERLAILIYYILFPLKCVVVIVLREDIEQIFSRSVYSLRSRDYDTDEEEEFDFQRHFAPFVRKTGAQEEESSETQTQALYGA